MSPAPSRPLQIYLDSNDFSVLSDSRRASPELAAIAAQLDTSKQSGAIEFRFSFAHVAEAAPTELAHIELATARLKCIDRMCFPCALIAPGDLISMEAGRLYSIEAETSEIYRDNGDWLPNFIDDLEGLPSRADLVRHFVRSMNLGREQNRAMERAYFDRKGHLTAQGRAILSKSTDGFVAQVGTRYPLTKESKMALRQYIAGQVEGGVAMRAIMKSIVSLPVFAGWLNSRWDEMSGVTGWLRQSGDKLRSAFADLGERAAQLSTQSLAAGMTQR